MSSDEGASCSRFPDITTRADMVTLASGWAPRWGPKNNAGAPNAGGVGFSVPTLNALIIPVCPLEKGISTENNDSFETLMHEYTNREARFRRLQPSESRQAPATQGVSILALHSTSEPDKHHASLVRQTSSCGYRVERHQNSTHSFESEMLSLETSSLYALTKILSLKRIFCGKPCFSYRSYARQAPR